MNEEERKKMVELVKLKLAEERYKESRQLVYYSLPKKSLWEEFEENFPAMANLLITLVVSSVLFSVMVQLIG